MSEPKIKITGWADYDNLNEQLRFAKFETNFFIFTTLALALWCGILQVLLVKLCAE